MSISINNIAIVRDKKQLYSNFSLHVASEKVTCAIAPSGSGKTTLLCCIAGTLRNALAEGSILFNGAAARPSISFLFQEPRLIPSATVLQNVMLPLVNVMSKEAAKLRALHFLENVELGDKCASFPDELSGGEAQRVAVARSFAFPSSVLLLDEPFQSQDLKIKLHLIKITQRLLAIEKRTVFFVTHDPKEAVLLSDRILILAGTPLKIIFDEQNIRKNDAELENTIASLVVHSAI
ncbi:MAG: ABC transporter ATP-binding protein [Treponema sp.]|nr:ABC transporter ATP-binding protein [Treponema sp.]